MKNLVITAGGLSRRMGRDKVFLELGGKTFLECIFANASKRFERIIISTDTEEHKNRILSLPEIKNAVRTPEIVTDKYIKCGPIGGICSVFESTDADRFAIIPTDVPFADMRVLEFFYDIYEGKPVMLKRDNGDLEPLIGAYGRESRAAFKKALDEGNYKINRALKALECEYLTEAAVKKRAPELSGVDFEKCFVNINRPEDYGRLLEESVID